jgi:hypothetical protein
VECDCRWCRKPGGCGVGGCVCQRAGGGGLSGFRENFRSDSRGISFLVTHWFRGRSRDGGGSVFVRFCPVVSGFPHVVLQPPGSIPEGRVVTAGRSVRGLAAIGRVVFCGGFGCQGTGQRVCAVPGGLWRKAGSLAAVCPPIDYRFWWGENEPWAVCVGRWVDLRVFLSTVYRREEYLRLA